MRSLPACSSLLKRPRFLLGLSLLFLAGGTCRAGGARHEASLHQSHWGYSGSPLQCTLVHEIPAYGKALFIRSAGGGLIFSLRPRIRPPQVKEVRLTTGAPPWRHGEVKASPWRIPVPKGRLNIDLDGRYSARIFEQLAQGMSPTFGYIDPVNGGVEMEVVLSPVWLGPALAEFRSCIANLLPFSYEQIRRSALLFDFGSSRLLPKARERANQLAEFVLADKGVRRISIEGHTDNLGRASYNYRLGRRRAEAVKSLLLAKGVAAKKIVVRSHGERRPGASNKTDAGRAQNRRVVIRLER